MPPGCPRPSRTSHIEGVGRAFRAELTAPWLPPAPDMDSVTPFDWHRMFIGDEPPLFFLEILFRVVVIYLFAAVCLRFMGKRGQRQLSPFEFVVVIALGSATGDAMFYPDVPILYAWVVIAAVVGLSSLVAKAQLWSVRINTFLEGTPRPLVWEGRVLDDNVRRENLRPDEFLGMLREAGIEQTGDVHYVFLERSGNIGYVTNDDPDREPGTSTFPRSLNPTTVPPKTAPVAERA